jgi:ferritin-like protein
MASEGFHEREEHLKPETRDMHRAVVSLMEELEAIDWYQQRVDATQDEELRAILAHNRDEEKEHAAMVLEWIRRHDPKFDGELRAYLFSEGPIVGREEAVTRGAGDSVGGPTIGSLKGAMPGSKR